MTPRLSGATTTTIRELTRGFQAARVKALQAAYRKAQAQGSREDAPTAGQIRNLGLLNKEEDTKKVLESR